MRILQLALMTAIAAAAGCDGASATGGTGDRGAEAKLTSESSDTTGGGLLEGLAPPSSEVADSGVGDSRTRFRNAAAELGVDFTFRNDIERGRRLMPEATAGPGGWLDYDGDGRPDLFLGQGGDPATDAPESEPPDHLYRNRAGGPMRESAAQAVLPPTGFAHGVASADYDGDGFADLYVAGVGADRLLRNLGDGTFEDVTGPAGVSDPEWSSGAAFGDLTGDGVTDLYVANYVAYDPRNPIACFDSAGNAGTCHPNDVDAEDNRFYAGNGDGTFREASAEFGFQAGGGKSLAVIVADLTSDGLPDVYVANDVTPNHLFVRGEDGRFREEGVLQGAAANELGQYQASMGLAFGDYDADGLEDVYVTHFTQDSNTLYRRLSSGFADRTRSEGLHSPTLSLLGFGTVMTDFDADGTQDLFVANGHIDDWRGTNGDDYHMRPQLFSRMGGVWREADEEDGDYFAGEYLGRAVATADFDRDGDTDLAVVHQNAPAAVLENVSESGRWLRVEPVGVMSPRTPVGVVVEVTAGGRTLRSQLPGGTSYAASHEPSLHFGLGDVEGRASVHLRWPSGAEETYEDVPLDRSLKAVEGRGVPAFELLETAR